MASSYFLPQSYIRAFGFNHVMLACRRQTYLPVELLAQAGVSQEALYRGQASDNLSDVVFQVASNAKVGHTDHTAHTF